MLLGSLQPALAQGWEPRFHSITDGLSVSATPDRRAALAR
jgi:hypothetical protein